MEDLLYLIPLLPIAGFVVNALVGRRLGEPASGYLATLAVVGSFAATVAVFLELLGRPESERTITKTLFEWIPVGDFSVDIGFLADPLSIGMALFITGIGALIHLYSIGYMHGDSDFSRFFVYLNLFVAAMLLLVLGDNLLLTFGGWEGVGACSYLLITFWYSSEDNASAGKKAFVTNRIGDWGFMIGIFATFFTFGTINYLDLTDGVVGTAAQTTVTAIAVAFFIGAIGKSAQIPLFVWLPDAMAGPTPVSALIHAATMVTSGVYLLVRLNPFLAASADWVPTLVAWVGAITALFAATIAVAQTDIKKVLAYSTVSQLGYMFLAVGTGAYVAAIFHMITHAFFKALLFLGAGSVIHGMGDEQDMTKMGGLRTKMVITSATFIVGWLAIAGVPPLAGFWSKDEILAFAYEENIALWIVGLLTAVLTAFYMSRQVFMTFFGEPRWDEDTHPHESPALMWIPLVVLAGLAMVAGVLNLPFGDSWHRLGHWLGPVVHTNEAELTFSGGTQWVLALIAIAGAALGILAAAARYLRSAKVSGDEPSILKNGWYFDNAISAVMGGPGRALFGMIAWFDRNVVDGIVNGVASVSRAGGGLLRRVQTGYVRSYALGIAGGAIALIAWFLTRAAL